MAYPKNQRSALLALAASAGLWAWQNRDKISTWVNDQKRQLEQRQNSPMQRPTTSTQYPTSTYTGETRRFEEPTTLPGRPDTVLGDRGRDI